MRAVVSVSVGERHGSDRLRRLHSIVAFPKPAPPRRVSFVPLLAFFGYVCHLRYGDNAHHPVIAILEHVVLANVFANA